MKIKSRFLEITILSEKILCKKHKIRTDMSSSTNSVEERSVSHRQIYVKMPFIVSMSWSGAPDDLLLLKFYRNRYRLCPGPGPGMQALIR